MENPNSQCLTAWLPSAKICQVSLVRTQNFPPRPPSCCSFSSCPALPPCPWHPPTVNCHQALSFYSIGIWQSHPLCNCPAQVPSSHKADTLSCASGFYPQSRPSRAGLVGRPRPRMPFSPRPFMCLSTCVWIYVFWQAVLRGSLILLEHFHKWMRSPINRILLFVFLPCYFQLVLDLQRSYKNPMESPVQLLAASSPMWLSHDHSTVIKAGTVSATVLTAEEWSPGTRSSRGCVSTTRRTGPASVVFLPKIHDITLTMRNY